MTSAITVQRTSQPGIAEAAVITPIAPLTPLPARAPSSNVLAFDGSVGYASAWLDVSETDYTVAIWFKTTDPNCGIFSVDSGEQGSDGHGRHIWLNNGDIYTRLWENEIIKTSGNNFADGTWHKVTHVYGGSIGGQRIYADGQFRLARGSKANSDFNGQDGINVGFSNDAQNPYFTGEISEASIWSVARPEAAIISQKELLVGNEPGLLAFWNFKDGSGNAIVDRTANKIILTINSNADWQRPADFSGVFTPVVHPDVVAFINEQGQQLAGAAKVLPQGTTDFTDHATAEQLSQ